ncbi:nucleotidyltransferase family protein [Pseudooctadecabacter jejudonensis]|uniref:2-C-methyl-D-erythritol 4-phosphate cytidylyltransferase n=1 Tax=Pseudooctadecabacter jejudonensis TaxID=1391910 RepID=A0A1Y5S6E1_9RHOB|nr:nucleotidyltransferase family protein [Pseudooctadecabacter jejudonensis]SLN33308.1 2-C-methyl-D-erythritol 4-phosphate cytidylyltransferase [Pseudooctadecabacter jejudonensis]
MTQPPTSILLFAAGRGTRMAPLTDTQPKPMIKVAGRPLLDHALQFCGGLNRVVNVHYLAHQIEDHLRGTDIKISNERDKLLETGGGLKKARDLLGPDPVFAMNTDAVWAGPNPLDLLQTVWDPDHMDGLLLMIPRPNATAHIGTGDFNIAEDGRISRGSDFVYSGVQIIRTDILDTIDEDAFSMWSLWTPMLTAGRLFGAVYTGQWCDVGRPENIATAEHMLGASHV